MPLYLEDPKIIFCLQHCIIAKTFALLSNFPAALLLISLEFLLVLMQHGDSKIPLEDFACRLWRHFPAVPPLSVILFPAFQDFTVTIIDQNTTLFSLAMTAQCDNIVDPNALVPLYPTLSASLVQATPSEVPYQGYNLAPSYQDGSQLYYYSLNSLGRLTTGELEQCLQAYRLVSYSGTQASSLQPEMVMMLKEFHSMNVQTPFSTSAFYYPTSAQAMPDSSLQGENRARRGRSEINPQTKRAQLYLSVVDSPYKGRM